MSRATTTRLAALALLPLAACGGEDERTVTVLAAASLTETFTELAEAFEAEHPGVDVELVLGSSTALAEQVADGAPGDLLATADERSMQAAADGGALAAPAVPFAENALTLVTRPDDPATVDSLADLDSPDVDLVVCAVTAPCGALAAALLEDEDVRTEPASEEVDVKAVLARVAQGEADAGLVYRTDAVAAGDDVAEVPVPEAAAYATTYLIAPLHNGGAGGGDDGPAELATAFLDLVRSTEGQRVLEQAGFGAVLPP